MKNATKEFLESVLWIYVIMSVLCWIVRMSAGGDCEHRYIDYVFPITLLHCKVAATK